MPSREMAAEGMNVNSDGKSKTIAMFWSWKGRGADGGNKRRQG